MLSKLESLAGNFLTIGLIWKVQDSLNHLFSDLEVVARSWVQLGPSPLHSTYSHGTPTFPCIRKVELLKWPMRVTSKQGRDAIILKR